VIRARCDLVEQLLLSNGVAEIVEFRAVKRGRMSLWSGTLMAAASKAPGFANTQGSWMPALAKVRVFAGLPTVALGCSPQLRCPPPNLWCMSVAYVRCSLYFLVAVTIRHTKVFHRGAARLGCVGQAAGGEELPVRRRLHHRRHGVAPLGSVSRSPRLLCPFRPSFLDPRLRRRPDQSVVSTAGGVRGHTGSRAIPESG